MLAAAGPPSGPADSPPGPTLSSFLSSWTARTIPSPTKVAPAAVTTPREKRADRGRAADQLRWPGGGSEATWRAATAAALGGGDDGEHSVSFGRNLHALTGNKLTPLLVPVLRIGGSASSRAQAKKAAAAEAAAAAAGNRKRRRDDPPLEARHGGDRGTAPLTVELDLATLKWGHHRSSTSKHSGGAVPGGCTLAAAVSIMSTKRPPQQEHRRSNDAAVATVWGRSLLASAAEGSADFIHPGTEMAEVEACVTSALEIIRCISSGSGNPEWDWVRLPQGQDWCVGGSVDATYTARDAEGCAQSLCLVSCSSHARGGARNVAVACSTCERHCVIKLDEVMVAGQWWQTLQLRKCGWANCCERRRPFASPPEIPWRAPCGQQAALSHTEDSVSRVPADGITLVMGETAPWFVGDVAPVRPAASLSNR